MYTLAIDIGGTKFSAAIFEGDRLVRRHSGVTDREGGRDWMLHQIQETGRAWQREFVLARCGGRARDPIASRWVPSSRPIAGEDDLRKIREGSHDTASTAAAYSLASR